MANMFGFDTDALYSAAKLAEKEARNVYHYGHMPDKPKEHAHTANGDCSAACKAAYLIKEAATHITRLESVPGAIKKIIDENEGYFVIPAIEEFLAGLQIKGITLEDSFTFLHENAEDSCGCDECASGVTLKKFGVIGSSPGSPVTSVTSLEKAMTGSTINYLSKIYTKGSDSLWRFKLEGYAHESKEFAGAIQSNLLIWGNYKILEDDLESVESGAATEADDSIPPWFKDGTKLKFSDLELCPPGTQIQALVSNKPYGDKLYKKVNGMWGMNSSWSGYEYNTEDIHSGFDWAWLEPKGNTPCAKAKADWKEKNSPKKNKPVEEVPILSMTDAIFTNVDGVKSVKFLDDSPYYIKEEKGYITVDDKAFVLDEFS